MPFDNPLKKFLDPFGCPSIYLTGKDLLEGVECAVGNVYASDQLAVAYLGRKDSVRIVLNGKGSFAENLGKLQENLKVTLKLVLLLAVRYAIAAQILSRGGTSLDAVQKCVSALEDCSLFNAGKGAVFNRNGEHELEATIVDGNRKKSGSVACLHTVKNPVRAARKVMENSAHVLLVGEGAEEFLQGLPEKEQPVNAEYFHTDIRRRELEANLSGGITSKNNHPQTVGAVAVDHWGNFAAATSTGGLVGKWKGRIGDTAIFGAGIYADEKLALTCTGDGDVFLKETVAHKVATLYTHKGYSLREACREVIHEKGFQGGIIAVDSRGDAGHKKSQICFVSILKYNNNPPTSDCCHSMV
uniref:Isoaspartyl peptidase/L-asparaginase n=1 Tax=Denticeps clupeoides TaxID=299321 RepID=A0AAY4AMT9_9TELE